MPSQNGPGPNAASGGGKARGLDRLGGAIGLSCNKTIPHSQYPVEHVLDSEALGLLAEVRVQCGAGVVRGCEFWAVEAARAGTDWIGILATVAATAALCQRLQAPELRRAAG
jgi:uridylate kinase